MKSRVNRGRLGKAFESEIRRSIEYAKKERYGKRLWGERWPDSRALRLFIKGGGVKAPADFVLCFRGLLIALECKSTHQKSFPLRNLTTEQQDALSAISEAGGRSYVVISYRKRGSSVTYAIDIAL